jgi:hypothetical protein
LITTPLFPKARAAVHAEFFTAKSKKYKNHGPKFESATRIGDKPVHGPKFEPVKRVCDKPKERIKNLFDFFDFAVFISLTL